MVPFATLFTVALSRQFAKLIVTEQHWIAEQQEDLDRAMQVEAREGGYAEQRAWEIALGGFALTLAVLL